MSTRRPRQVAPQMSGVYPLLRDHEAAPLLGLSAGFLRKDRKSLNPAIPAIKVGDRWLYDVQQCLSALRSRSVGGRQ